MNAHPKESGHYYASEPFMDYKPGDQVGRVPNATGKKLITPDRRHAKKFNLYPGVTTILKQLAKPGLDIWKENQLLESFATLPEEPGESIESRISRVRYDAKAHVKDAAEWGTELHRWFQEFIEKKSMTPIPAEWREYVEVIWDRISDYADHGYWVAEESFAHPLGYGGKVDLYCPLWLMDLKGREWDEKQPTGYFDNAMQLAAYDQGIGSNRRIANVFVNRKRPEVVVQEWTEEEQLKALKAFNHLTSIWKIVNGFD